MSNTVIVVVFCNGSILFLQCCRAWHFFYIWQEASGEGWCLHQYRREKNKAKTTRIFCYMNWLQQQNISYKNQWCGSGSGFADPDPDLWIRICIIQVGSGYGSVWRDTNPDPDPGHIRNMCRNKQCQIIKINPLFRTFKQMNYI